MKSTTAARIVTAIVLGGCWTSDPPPAAPKPPPVEPAKRTVPPPQGSFGETFTIMVRFKDDICACNDMPCVEKVTGEMTKWGTEASKRIDDQHKPTPAETRRMTEIAKQLTDCMSRTLSNGNNGP